MPLIRPSMHPSRLLLILAGSLCAYLLLVSCTRRAEQIVLSGPTMGTIYSVKVVRAPREITAHGLRTAIEEELQHIDNLMSGYREDSEIARFNAARSTEWVEVSDDLAKVVATALEVSAESDGAFDVTIAPLVRLWGFGSQDQEPDQLPDRAAVDHMRERIGHEKLHVRATPPSLRKDVPELTVDLNGIAPGFAVDRIASRMEALGLSDYMIDIGGEVKVRGRNSALEPWRIAVEKPVDADPSAPFAILSLKDVAVTTSGEYRHYYERDGRRYSHTIDPRTGEPISHALASVVVIAARSDYADAWATAFNVLGATEGYELAERRSMPVMFIEERKGTFAAKMTPAFRGYVATSKAD
jgi:thiamine biosynthesis lipoprotein